MAKPKSTQKATTIPLAPVLFINNPLNPSTGKPEHALALLALLPKHRHLTIENCLELKAVVTLLETTKTKKSVAVFISTEPHGVVAPVIEHVNTIKRTCIEHGRNFISINLFDAELVPSGSTDKRTIFGTNHLAYPISDHATSGEVAKDIMKFLFKTLAPIETLHLISDAEMQTIDTKDFGDYAYCPVAECRLRNQDDKIQFVIVVTSKAIVSEAGKLTWTVADKSGIANFYFLHRGPSSQYTWDWVLALQVGQRVALPRMPAVQVKEPARKRTLKAPFRLVGHALTLTADAVLLAGRAVKKAGATVRMGRSSRWVPRADAVVDAAGKARDRRPGEAVQEWEHVRKAGAGEGEAAWRVFDEKGRLAWEAADEDARTEKGSVAEGEAERREKEALLA